MWSYVLRRLLATIPTIGVTVLTPPETPKDRVELLRGGMAKMAEDDEFRRQMAALNMVVDPLAGAKVEALVRSEMTVDKGLVDATLRYTAPRN